jgi:hypothetical protein
MACPVCVHPLVTEIDANRAHLSLRQLETRYRVSRSSLGRHQQRCRQPSQPGDTRARVLAPAPPSNPLAAYHGEAVQLAEACRQAKYMDNWTHMARALADLLVRLTDPGAGR